MKAIFMLCIIYEKFLVCKIDWLVENFSLLLTADFTGLLKGKFAFVTVRWIGKFFFIVDV